MSKQEKRLANWEKIKNKGFLSYIIKQGMILNGLTFFLLMVFLIPFIDNNYQFNFIYKQTFKTKLITCGILSPLYGTFMGYICWKILGIKYE